MTTPSTPAGSQWTGWQKVLFRFFFIYFLLFIPSLISDLPVLKYVQNVYNTRPIATCSISIRLGYPCR
jgi:hypothetical protein